jgi:hypothetical protein
MSYNKRLELPIEHYEKTKEIIIKNGSKVWEQSFGSRKSLYGDGEICGIMSTQNYLPLSNINSLQLGAFLGQFTKSLYSQIRKNDNLLNLKINFFGVSRDKNESGWIKLKPKEYFYNVDLSSAYWQIAYRLGYISKRMFSSYIEKDDYKEAKRYCISFLARENEMQYHDGREIDLITCDIEVLNQIYTNIRNELYNCIQEVLKDINEWIEFNIDGVTIREKDLDIVCRKFNELNLIYKTNKCLKIDSNHYLLKGKIRNF